MNDDLPARNSPLWTDWLTFLRAYKTVLERINQELAKKRLPTIIEYSTLFWLNHAEENRLSQVDLSRGVLVSKSRVTRVMNALVDQGYVRREKDGTDKRITFAVLTEKGREAFERTTPTFATAFNASFASHIGPTDYGTITRLLNPIAWQDEAGL